MINPLFKIENYERKSRLYFCGINISEACFHIDYSSHTKATDLGGTITLELEIPKFIEALANASEEERRRAADTFETYLQLYRKPEIPA